MADKHLDLKLGDREGPALEFKDKRALNDPAKLARSAVAMLNSGGGNIYVGVEEQGERAVALQDIAMADHELTRLRDSFSDRIRPRPTDSEIELATCTAGAATLLRIGLHPQDDRRPYAWTDEQRCEFVERFGSRTRHMAYDEIAHQFRAKASGGDSAEEREKMRLAWTQRWLEWRTHQREVLAIAIVPMPARELRTSAPELRALLSSPTLSGNRPMGWNFVNRYAPILEYAGGMLGNSTQGISVDPTLERTPMSDPERLGDPALRIWLLDDGTVLVEEALERFRSDFFQSRVPRRLHPEALVEFPVSVLRLAGTLYRHLPPRRVQVLLRTGQLGDWHLPPGSSRQDVAPLWPVPEGGRAERVDLSPLEVDGEALVRQPDGVGWELVTRLYKAFAYSDEAIPEQFERGTRRLNLRETPPWPPNP